MEGHRQSCKSHEFPDISDIIREETQQQALLGNKWRTVWGILGSEKMLATKGWAETTGCIWWARQRRSRWCRGPTGSPTPPSPGATSPPPARSPTLWAQWVRWVKLSFVKWNQQNKDILKHLFDWSFSLLLLFQVSCVTTVSMDSEAGADPEGRLADFREEEERCVYRSGFASLRREAREIRI